MTKKIIYLANIRFPTEKAHGIQVMRMCEAFVVNGMELELVIPRRFNPIKESPFSFYQSAGSFSLRKIFCLDLVSFGQIGYWLQFVSFMLSANIFILYRKLIKREDFIIYTRGEPILFLKSIGKHLCPVFWETHIKPSRGLRTYLRAACLAKGIITVTEFYRQELLGQYHLQNVLCEPDGVDLKKFDIPIDQATARSRVNLPLDKKIALYTGSFYLYDYKGVDIFLEAAKLLAPDTLVVLVGGREKEIREIRERGIGENVQLLSHVNQNLIPYFLRAADVLVLPNKKGNEISEKYTSPLKLFEYMAAGRPIVFSDTISSREILNDKIAFMFEASNSHDLTGKIKTALTEESLAREKAQLARQKVQRYSWDERARKILEFAKQNIK